MAYAVIFTAGAAGDLRKVRAAERASITDLCLRLLATNPTLTSKARVKILTGDSLPTYRLRVGDYRVFYDVEEESERVIIHGIVKKDRVDEWLARFQRGGAHHENGNDI